MFIIHFGTIVFLAAGEYKRWADLALSSLLLSSKVALGSTGSAEKFHDCSEVSVTLTTGVDWWRSTLIGKH